LQKTNIYLLAIESSCDDTSCAIMCNNKVLANITANQSVHEQYGGVIPELASRDHQKNIVPVVHAALKRAGIELRSIDAIAVTMGPGLMGSLLVGMSFAKSLALALNVPLIGVNHMQAHILAHFIEDGNHESESTPNQRQRAPEFPFLCLTVSGGHTQLVRVNDYLDFEVMGQTIDDAVGEAFDKAAKVLGLPYPGGPLIDQLAVGGNKHKYQFATAKAGTYDYSFSGIKTSFLYFIQNNVQANEHFISENLKDICASYQNHLIQVLLKKAKQALNDSGISSLAIAGGVSANSVLREEVRQLEQELSIKTFIPKFEYCTDNAAMIGVTAYFMFSQNRFSEFTLVPSTRMSL
jgi:N6-L-threonylcarbamoyladenine synthase